MCMFAQAKGFYTRCHTVKHVALHDGVDRWTFIRVGLTIKSRCFDLFDRLSILFSSGHRPYKFNLWSAQRKHANQNNGKQPAVYHVNMLLGIVILTRQRKYTESMK